MQVARVPTVFPSMFTRLGQFVHEMMGVVSERAVGRPKRGDVAEVHDAKAGKEAAVYASENRSIVDDAAKSVVNRYRS